MDDRYNTHNEIKKVLSKSFDSNMNTAGRNGWVSSLRERTEGVGESIRTICCEKMEETIASPMLSPNKRTFLRNSSGKRATTQVKDNDKAWQPVPGRDFVTECSQPDKQAVKRRFVFPGSLTTKASTANYLPAHSEVPLYEI